MRFQAKNFKRSDESVSLSLKPLTILLGQNGAGKTTLARALALGHHVVKSKLGELTLEASWSKKFNVFGYDDVANDIADSMEFEWVLEEFTYRQRIERNEHGISYSKYEICYTENNFTVYQVEVGAVDEENNLSPTTNEIEVLLCPAFFKLVKNLALSGLNGIHFEAEEFDFASVEDKEEWLRLGGNVDLVLDSVRGIKNGDAKVHSARVNRPRGETHTYVEDGLVGLLESLPDVRDDIANEWPAMENVLLLLKSSIDPQNPSRIPLLKTFKVKDRVTLPRTFDPSSRLWGELVSRKNLAFADAWGEQTGDWLKSWLDKIGLCGFTVKEPLSGVLTVHFDDGYGHFDLGTGHRQIFVLLLEFCFMLEWYEKRKPKGQVARHIFVIEEPEVSLHPNAQTWILEILLGFQAQMDKIDVGILFVIETHSEYFLRRAQLAVKEGDVTESHVGINYVSTGGNGVAVAEYELDSNGLLLKKLPEGFMDESSRLIREVHFRN